MGDLDLHARVSERGRRKKDLLFVGDKEESGGTKILEGLMDLRLCLMAVEVVGPPSCGVTG